MSAFLGPIHYWVFNKVQLQNQLVDMLIAYAESKGYAPYLRAQLADQYGELELAPLETIIDGSNIHGWLQERVSMVEYRLAYAITKILNQDATALPEIQELFYQAGREKSADSSQTAAETFKYISDALLDGMPCDRANDVISESDAEVVWRRNICVHIQYWEAVDGDIATYYLLRDSFINGMLENSGYVFEKMDNVTSKLRR